MSSTRILVGSTTTAMKGRGAKKEESRPWLDTTFDVNITRRERDRERKNERERELYV